MDNGPQCTCEKSECLQRYCKCFQSRYYCTDECSCVNCHNTEDNADEVDERADSILKKKPDAFKPKVIAGAGDGSGLQQQEEEARVHVRGCNCRKSECKKLYCECFKHRVGCSAKCQCTACANKFGVKGVVPAAEKDDDSPTGTSGGVLAVVPAAETDDDSPTGTSGGSGATFAGSDGALSTVDDMFNVPADQASTIDDFSSVPVAGDWTDWCVDLVPQTRAMGDGGLEVIFQHFRVGDNFQHNVDPQSQQGFVQADGSLINDANFVLQQGPSSSDTCSLNHGSQINKFGGFL